jgi:AraC-like DNA-binding protein
MLDRPERASGDPLLDVLDLLRLERAKPAQLRAGGDWAVAFAPYAHAKFAAVLEGTCWLAGEALGEPLQLRAGDAYVLANGRPYRLGSAPTGPAERGSAVFARAQDGVAHAGFGTDVSVLGGSLVFASRHARLLLDALPPLIVLRQDDSAAATVRAAVELLAVETRRPGFGSALVVDRLADILLVQALRAVTARGGAHGGTGWLSALADPQVGEALRLLHGDMARRWTVAELGAAVGLSRSAFAERFRRLVGQPPLDYQLQWRMAAAAQALESEERTVSSVATEWGYASDSAFSTAFKRVMGSAPSLYRR